MSIKFSKDYLKNKLHLPFCSIDDRIIKVTRWSIKYEIVFEDKGKFYKTTYSRGATEYQDESPWEYEDEVECTEVELKEVKIKEWVPVEQNDN